MYSLAPKYKKAFNPIIDDIFVSRNIELESIEVKFIYFCNSCIPVDPNFFNTNFDITNSVLPINLTVSTSAHQDLTDTSIDPSDRIKVEITKL